MNQLQPRVEGWITAQLFGKAVLSGADSCWWEGGGHEECGERGYIVLAQFLIIGPREPTAQEKSCFQ